MEANRQQIDLALAECDAGGLLACFEVTGNSRLSPINKARALIKKIIELRIGTKSVVDIVTMYDIHPEVVREVAIRVRDYITSVIKAANEDVAGGMTCSNAGAKHGTLILTAEKLTYLLYTKKDVFKLYSVGIPERSEAYEAFIIDVRGGGKVFECSKKHGLSAKKRSNLRDMYLTMRWHVSDT